MSTLSGFTRPSDPIDATGMAAVISAAIGSAVSVVITPSDLIVSGDGLSDSNKATVQSAANSYVYPITINGVPIADSPDMSQGRHAVSVSEYAAYNADLSIANSRTAVRFYDGGVAMNGSAKTGDIIVWIDSTTTTSGNAVFYLTSNHAASGNALFSSISTNSVDTSYVDSTTMYAKSSPTVSSDMKTVTIPVTKQTMNIVSVAGINVVGSVSMPNAGNGVTVKLFIVGVAA